MRKFRDWRPGRERVFVCARAREREREGERERGREVAGRTLSGLVSSSSPCRKRSVVSSVLSAMIEK